MKTTLGKVAALATASSAALFIPAGLAQAQVHPPLPHGYHRIALPRALKRLVPLAAGTVKVTQSLDFTAAEPADIYAHVTTTGLPGSVTVSEHIYCEGILQEDGDLPSITGIYVTPAEFAVTPVFNGGVGCTVDITAVTVGQDMGTVSLFTTNGI